LGGYISSEMIVIKESIEEYQVRNKKMKEIQTNKLTIFGALLKF